VLKLVFFSREARGLHPGSIVEPVDQDVYGWAGNIECRRLGFMLVLSGSERAFASSLKPGATKMTGSSGKIRVFNSY
jgi:hypothetical protein